MWTYMYFVFLYTYSQQIVSEDKKHLVIAELRPNLGCCATCCAPQFVASTQNLSGETGLVFSGLPGKSSVSSRVDAFVRTALRCHFWRWSERVAENKNGSKPRAPEKRPATRLDDYLMTSDRISRAWTKRHTLSRKYWPDPTGRTWRDVAQGFLVVSTDEQHMVRHREWILKTSLPADLMHIKLLWKT
jgi:hypothetical protein